MTILSWFVFMIFKEEKIMKTYKTNDKNALLFWKEKPLSKDGLFVWLGLVEDHGKKEAVNKAKQILRKPLPGDVVDREFEITFRDELVSAIYKAQICSDEEFFFMQERWEILKRLTLLQEFISDFLVEAPGEEYCTEEENGVFADMQNLKESINRFFDEQAR